ncbi:hypothetical protein MalM25_20500 [Planctomycetes bacterium MalM25]|nr:hypothetical protein MalM25_20500 [Planctomycetes bacterium MalM25]
MIVSVLTCLFVMYLYQHLKAEEEAASGEGDTAGGLEQRIASLRARLEALASAPRRGGDAS